MPELEWQDKAKVMRQAKAEGHLFEVVWNHGVYWLHIDGKNVSTGMPTVSDAMEIAEVALKKLRKAAQGDAQGLNLRGVHRG